MKRIKKYKQPAFMGIDPGAGGAVALISGNKVLWEDYESPEIVANTICEWLKDFDIILCVLEKVHAMPKQGVVSVFKFGTNWGIWQGILAAYKIPNKHVTPQAWQKVSFVRTDGDNTKDRSLNSARRLWPNAELHLKRHNGRSDALHLANYAKNNISGG